MVQSGPVMKPFRCVGSEHKTGLPGVLKAAYAKIDCSCLIAMVMQEQGIHAESTYNFVVLDLHLSAPAVELDLKSPVPDV